MDDKGQKKPMTKVLMRVLVPKDEAEEPWILQPCWSMEPGDASETDVVATAEDSTRRRQEVGRRTHSSYRGSQDGRDGNRHSCERNA